MKRAALARALHDSYPALRAGYNCDHQPVYGNGRAECEYDADYLLERAETVIDADYLTRQREFSLDTFGPAPRVAGVIDHIRKEIDEIEAEPHDLSEWADLLILAFDGAMRAGYEPEEVLAAVHAKQAINESRNWPDWRDSDPDRAIEHIR